MMEDPGDLCDLDLVADLQDCGCHVDVRTDDSEDAGTTLFVHRCATDEKLHEPIRRVADMFADRMLVQAERYVEMQLSIITADRLAEGVRQVVENDFKVPMSTPDEYLRALREMYLGTRGTKT